MTGDAAGGLCLKGADRINPACGTSRFLRQILSRPEQIRVERQVSRPFLEIDGPARFDSFNGLQIVNAKSDVVAVGGRPLQLRNLVAQSRILGADLLELLDRALQLLVLRRDPLLLLLHGAELGRVGPQFRQFLGFRAKPLDFLRYADEGSIARGPTGDGLARVEAVCWNRTELRFTGDVTARTTSRSRARAAAKKRS